MQVVLEKLNLPEKGAVQIEVQRSFEIKVTAEDARRKVSRWLFMEVSTALAADPPALIIDQTIVWRVPAWLGLPRHGRLGGVGTIDVDVRTGELYNLVERKREIERCAQKLAQNLPPFQPYGASVDFIPTNVPLAVVLNPAQI